MAARWKPLIFVLAGCIGFTQSPRAQEVEIPLGSQLVAGDVYRCQRPDIKERVYSSRPLEGWTCARIRYSYYDQLPAAPTFLGYRCTQDCSGHEAGYEWAQRKGITDPDECGGNSQSFIEGCIAWAEEQ